MPCGFSPQGIRYLECLIAVSKILSEENTVCSGEVRTCLKKECLRCVEGSGNTVTAVGVKWVKVWKRVFGDVSRFLGCPSGYLNSLKVRWKWKVWNSWTRTEKRWNSIWILWHATVSTSAQMKEKEIRLWFLNINHLRNTVSWDRWLLSVLC